MIIKPVKVGTCQEKGEYVAASWRVAAMEAMEEWKLDSVTVPDAI